MFWKKAVPILTVALSRLDVEVDADLQIPLETQEDFEVAIRIIKYARRKSLPIKTWRVYMRREEEVGLKLRWLLEVARLDTEVELVCTNPKRIQKILTRHRSQIRVVDWPKS